MEPVYVSDAAGLTALVGQAAYERLAGLCADRAARGLVAPHPATTAAEAGAADASSVGPAADVPGQGRRRGGREPASPPSA